MTPNRVRLCNEERKRPETDFSLIESMRSMSSIVGSLDIAGSFFEKMNNIYSYASSGIIKTASLQNGQYSKTNEVVAASSDSQNTVTEKNKLKNGHSHDNAFPKLKHSHSQSCMTECPLAHHAKISSWSHSLSVHRSHVPRRVQEPYIEYGYLLPFMPWRYYLKALYTPSYEFANVWTHLFPALYFVYLLNNFSCEMDVMHAWPLFLITFSGIILGTFSALAHMFHSRSSLHHSCWFVTDYFGITLYAFSSLTTNFYSGAQLEYYKLLSPNYLYITVTMCSFGFICLCLTQTNQKLISTKISRKIKVCVNGFGYAFGALPLFKRIYENFLTGKTELPLQLHAFAIVGMLVAPIIYGMDIPQCLYPGKFDVFGHSHMWFHIITALSMWCHINAVYFDIIEGPWKVISQEADYPTFSGVVFCYFILILYGLICGYIIHCSVKCDYPDEEPFLQGKILCSCGLPETMRLHSPKQLPRLKTLATITELKVEEKID